MKTGERDYVQALARDLLVNYVRAQGSQLARDFVTQIRKLPRTPDADGAQHE